MGKKQLAIVLVIMAVVLIGALVFLYYQIKRAGDMWPHENKIGTLANTISKLETEIHALNQDVAKIPAAKEELEAYRIEYELAGRVLPRESTPDQLLAAIRTKAEQAGITPNRIMPKSGGSGGKRGSSSFEEWSFTLDLVGSYDQIAAFVNRMEEFESADATRTGSEKRFFKISSIAINAEDNGLAALGGSPPESVKGHKCVLVMQTYRYTGSE